MDNTTNPSRRAVLRMAGTAGIGLVTVTFLGACGGSGESATAPQVTPEMVKAVQSVISGGIPVGQAAFLKDVKLIVTRPEEKQYKVFSDVCPHARGQVTMQDEATGRLVCVVHGSQFDPKTGAVVAGPSTAGLTEVPGALPKGTSATS